MPRASASSPALPRLERWFQARIHRPQEGARSLPNPKPETWLLPSKHLAPGERLDLYSDMFFSRMHDSLAEDFPTLRQRLGEARFAKLVRAYLRAFPSRHYSLNFLGRRLPEFLRRPRGIARQDLLCDIARVENAMSEVFDAPESGALGEKEFRGVPAASWPRLRLRLHPALRLVSLRYAVNDAISATRQEKTPPRIRRCDQGLAVYRREHRVWRMELPVHAFAALEALSRGKTLAQAVTALARAWKGKPQRLTSEISRVFSEWAREGFFATIEFDKKQEKRQ